MRLQNDSQKHFKGLQIVHEVFLNTGQEGLFPHMEVIKMHLGTFTQLSDSCQNNCIADNNVLAGLDAFYLIKLQANVWMNLQWSNLVHQNQVIWSPYSRDLDFYRLLELLPISLDIFPAFYWVKIRSALILNPTSAVVLPVSKNDTPTVTYILLQQNQSILMENNSTLEPPVLENHNAVQSTHTENHTAAQNTIKQNSIAVQCRGQ